MVLWVPQKGILRAQHNSGEVGTITPGATVTTGASASTKGTPVELIASTAFDAYRIVIIASGYGTSAISSMGCMDILIGAATEEVLIPDLLMGFCGSFGIRDRGPKIWEFPLYIPAGSRISVQAAGERVSTAFNVVVYLYGGALPQGPVGGKVTSYGMVTIPSGTNIDPGANGNEGVWTEVVASTSQNHIALVPSFQSNLDTSLQQVSYQVDLGVGSATEEVIGLPYWYTSDTVETIGGPYPYTPCVQDIPAGTRLVMRASSSGAAQNFNCVIHAIS